MFRFLLASGLLLAGLGGASAASATTSTTTTSPTATSAPTSPSGITAAIESGHSFTVANGTHGVSPDDTIGQCVYNQIMADTDANGTSGDYWIPSTVGSAADAIVADSDADFAVWAVCQDTSTGHQVMWSAINERWAYLDTSPGISYDTINFASTTVGYSGQFEVYCSGYTSFIFGVYSVADGQYVATNAAASWVEYATRGGGGDTMNDSAGGLCADGVHLF
jgi:hypothetical protein